MSLTSSSRLPFHPTRWEARLYPGLLAQVSRVRKDVCTDLTGFPDEVIQALELCCSEIFANAVIHTASGDEGGEVARRLCLTAPDRLCLEVVDGGWTSTTPAVPDARHERDWMAAEDQRGLLLLQSCAKSWGYYQVLPHPALNLGLGVWAEFTVPPASVPKGLDHFIFTS